MELFQLVVMIAAMFTAEYIFLIPSYLAMVIDKMAKSKVHSTMAKILPLSALVIRMDLKPSLIIQLFKEAKEKTFVVLEIMCMMLNLHLLIQQTLITR